MKFMEYKCMKDGMKFMEYKCMKGQEDYTDKAFEELCCPEAGMCPLKAADEKVIQLLFFFKLSR